MLKRTTTVAAAAAGALLRRVAHAIGRAPASDLDVRPSAMQWRRMVKGAVNLRGAPPRCRYSGRHFPNQRLRLQRALRAAHTRHRD